MAERDAALARRLRLRDLHMLRVVVELGSMARAAEALALSQPAISKAIMEMERALGVPLVERSARGVAATAYGQVLAARGIAMLDELRQGIEEIRFLADPAQGEVRIGTTEPMTAVVGAAIARLSSSYPRMRFTVDVAPTKELLDGVRSRALDLALTRMADAAVPPDLRMEVLFRDPLAIIVDQRSPLLRRRRIALKDLQAEPWAIPPAETFLGCFLADVFRHRGLDLPPAVVSTRSVHMWVTLVRTGRFLGFGPSAMLRFRTQYPSLAALPIALPETRRPIALVSLANRAPAPSARLFTEATRAAVQALPAS